MRPTQTATAHSATADHATRRQHSAALLTSLGSLARPRSTTAQRINDHRSARASLTQLRTGALG